MPALDGHLLILVSLLLAAPQIHLEPCAGWWWARTDLAMTATARMPTATLSRALMGPGEFPYCAVPPRPSLGIAPATPQVRRRSCGTSDATWFRTDWLRVCAAPRDQWASRRLGYARPECWRSNGVLTVRPCPTNRNRRRR